MRRNRSVLYWFSSGTISKITPQRDLPDFPQVARLNSLHRIFPVLTTPLLLAYLEQLSIAAGRIPRSEEHTSELQSRGHLVCRLLLEKKELRAYLRSAGIKWAALKRPHHQGC